MKIVVLGASGFLGSKVYAKLKQDETLTVIGTCYNSIHSELEKLNLLDLEKVSQFFNVHQPDVLIWCLMDRNNEKELIDRGLTHLLRHVHHEKFFFVSTDAFLEGKGDYAEDIEMLNYPEVNPLSDYANAKIAGEKMVQHQSINHVIIRTGPLYGQDLEGNWSDQRAMNLQKNLANGQALYFHENIFKTFVHVDDLASAIAELCKVSYQGVLHMGSSKKASYYDFYKTLATKMNLNSELIHSKIMTSEEALANGFPMDTSMNTQKCNSILNTNFMNLEA